MRSTTILVYNWNDVINEFGSITGMSFGTQGSWNLDYTKLAGEPDFSGHEILQYEQDYTYFERGNPKKYCVQTLTEVLAKSRSCTTNNGKTFYRIPFHLVIEYLIVNDVLPENEQFFITTLSVFS